MNGPTGPAYTKDSVRGPCAYNHLASAVAAFGTGSKIGLLMTRNQENGRKNHLCTLFFF